MRTIIIFTKAPRLGYGKQRCADMLSPEERLTLCQKLISHTTRAALYALTDTDAQETTELAFHIAGDKDDLSFLESILSGAPARCEITYHPQVSGDLGARMYHAIQAHTPSTTLLIGTDLIGLDPIYLKNAFDLLEDADAPDLVCGPTFDGGYGLIGMKELHDVFTRMTWSHPEVMSDTEKKTQAYGLKLAKLSYLHDLDTKEDLIFAETGERVTAWETDNLGHKITISYIKQLYFPFSYTKPEQLENFLFRDKIEPTKYLERPLFVL